MNTAGERLEVEDAADSFHSPSPNAAHNHTQQHPDLLAPSFHFLRSSLLHIPILSTLSSETDDTQHLFDLLISSTHRLTLPPGTFLAKQDEVGKEFYIIEKGLVDVVKTRYKGRKSIKRKRGKEEQEQKEMTIVTTAGPGDMVGELPVFYNIPHQASLLTRTEVIAYSISRAAFDEFVSAHSQLSSTLHHRRWLHEVLSHHYLFALLDNESEKERLISTFYPRWYQQGQIICKEGEDADQFYILQEGDCMASTINPKTHSSVPMVVIHAGHSFGDISLLSKSRCYIGTVRCQSESGCTIWSISRRDFLAHCQRANLFLQAVFYRFAQAIDEVTHEKLMTRNNFLSAMRFITKFQRSSSCSSPLTDKRLCLMFRLADISGNSVISFTEFLDLHILLTQSHSFAELAFRMFDKNRTGEIDRDEFVRVLRWLAEDRGEKLDSNLDKYIDEVFKDRRTLSFEHFARLEREDSFPSFLSSIRTDLNAINSFVACLDTSIPASVPLLYDATSIIYLPPHLQPLNQIDDPLFRPSWRTLLAGGVAGAVSRTLVSPLERLKIVFQTQGEGTAMKYNGMWQGLRMMYMEDGLKGWFRGNWTNVIRVVPAAALQFMVYDIFKRFFFDHPFLPHISVGSEGKRELGSIQRLIAGAGAGMSACAITYPLDLIRVRLTLQSGSDARYAGIVDAFRQVYRQAGIKGFYLGLWPSMMGIAPYIGLEFAVYERLKAVAKKVEGEDRTVDKGKLLLCGATAGTAGQVVAYPIDTIRRRMQVHGFGPANYQYGHSILGMMKQIVKKEGIRGLYKGLIPNLCKVAPAASVSFLTYEFMRDLLGMEGF